MRGWGVVRVCWHDTPALLPSHPVEGHFAMCTILARSPPSLALILPLLSVFLLLLLPSCLVGGGRLVGCISMIE